MNDFVTVVGAGLAGSEAAYQLSKRGVKVRLVEMKPVKYSPAHKSDKFGELVCSNSLKAEHLTNGSGLLKAEMKKYGSLIIEAAENSRVPAGTALAVDRDLFSEYITNAIKNDPNIETVNELVCEIPSSPCIIATGPLTDPALIESIVKLDGMGSLNFFDASAPIVTAESINYDKAFAASRYDNGSDYINCPMTRDEYARFYDALVSAELADVHDFEKKMVFEGCLAVEILASRGFDTLAFGPLKPVGITDPHTGERPYAVVQLRRENESGTLYNMVGFQTRLKWGEQKRVFRMIPGLENAEFARYGVMHKNTFINSPKALTKNFAYKNDRFLRFAGQFTGVEGYVESAASGLMAAIGMYYALNDRPEPDFNGQTMLGALERYVRTFNSDFQPMNANFGIIDPPEKHIRAKRERYEYLSARAIKKTDEVISNL